MKILIADDELLVRRSIRMFLTDLGVRPDDMVETGDGFGLVEAIGGSHFDLALVDIRMPGMDGLEAVRRARETAGETDFYILSGFDDFKYAQEAIRLGVKDYILKPVRRADLEKIVENTISALEQRRALLLENLNLATAALLNIPGYTAHFPVPCRPVLIADDAPAQPFSVSELLAVDNDRITVIAHRDGGYVLLFLFETPEYPGYCREYLKDLAERYQSGHTLVEGRKFKDGTCWEEDYKRMRTLACLRSACGGRRLYPHTCLPPVDSRDFLPVCRCCETCLEAYGKSDYAGFTLACEAFLKSLEPVRQSHPGRAGNISRYLAEAFGLKDQSPDGLKSGLLMAAATFSASSKDFQYEEITAYIDRHYAEDLSLTGLAGMYGLSPNYFSTLFKKKAGCNFIHYLTSLRIAESKRLLLETNLTIREIAERVGYYSASFFIRSFKKAEEITPSEYRRKG